MTFTYARKIDALGGTQEGTGEYNAGYHDGYSRAVEAATEIAEDADEMIKELMDTLDAIVRPSGYQSMKRLIEAGELLLNRIEARLA